MCSILENVSVKVVNLHELHILCFLYFLCYEQYWGSMIMFCLIVLSSTNCYSSLRAKIKLIRRRESVSSKINQKPYISFARIYVRTDRHRIYLLCFHVLLALKGHNLIVSRINIKLRVVILYTYFSYRFRCPII
jgi:hypothetical protein